MTSMQIEILNPEARSVLQSLSKMKLIAIYEPPSTKEDFKCFIQKLQAQSNEEPTDEEITTDIEEIRSVRYAGDKDLLEIGEFDDTRIVTVSEFEAIFHA